MLKTLLRKPVLSWALYDWANSAFATTVIAGFFPIFYSHLSESISVSESQRWFNLVLAASSLATAVLSPILGAIVDAGGRSKKFLASFALLGILMSGSLAWVGSGMWLMGLMFYGFGQLGFSCANTFYDSLLTEVSDAEDVDLISGYGYALGYVGGGLLFVVNVLMVTNPQAFGFEDTAEALAMSFISVALWWLIFSIPIMLFVKEPATESGFGILQSLKTGIGQIKQTVGALAQLRQTVLFLLAYWFYIDGVGTVHRMAVFFANRVLGLPAESLITALLITQFVAFPSALAFGWMGNRIGPKAGILTGIVVYILAILYAWRWLDSSQDFYILAIAIGLVQGGVQSLSRSLFARLIPQGKTTEFFGFYNMVGKFASILGPLLIALLPLIWVGIDERDSILSLVVLFALGACLLLPLDLQSGQQAARDFNRPPVS